MKRMSGSNSTMDQEEEEEEEEREESNPDPNPDRMAPPPPAPEHTPTNMGLGEGIHQYRRPHPSPSNGQNSMIPGSGGTLPQVETVDLLGIEEGGHGSGSPDPLPPTSDMLDVALDAAQSDMPSDDAAAQWTDGMFPHMSPQNPETELSLSNIP